MTSFNRYLPLAIAVIVCSVQANAFAQNQDRLKPRVFPGRLIVTLKDGTATPLTAPTNSIQAAAVNLSASSINKLNAKYKVKRLRKLHHSDHLSAKLKNERRHRTASLAQAPLALAETYAIDMDPAQDLNKAIDEYKKNPQVAGVQLDYVHHSQMMPNDPYYTPYLWDMRKIQADKAWNLTQGENIVVAIVDTGADYTHPDLAANIWHNTKEVANNGVDDDNNGFVDDVRGWNFENYFSTGGNNEVMDLDGHGSHVAGTIAAQGNNGQGIIGVAPHAQVMPVRAIGANGGSSFDLAEGIIYATDNGADVISNSWGCDTQCPSDPAVEYAVRYAYSKGVVVVFAAGNSNDDVAFYSPQNMKEVINVAASDINDQRASFSNYGRIDVTAPGVNILSTVPNNHYAFYSGTSMAAPHVSGVIALILSLHPDLGVEDVRAALTSTADDIGAPGLDVFTGAGRVNAFKAIGTPSASVGGIAAPLNGAVLDARLKNIPIVGTAKGPNFEHYELAYSSAATPDQWVMIGAPVFKAVDNAQLGVWNVRTLPPGAYNLRLTAFYTQGSPQQSLVAVQVNNLPPSMAVIADKSVMEGAKLSFIVHAVDPEGQAVVYSAQLANGDPLSVMGATLNSATGTFNWPSAVAKAGGYQVRFTATDPAGQQASRMVSINVTAKVLGTINGRVVDASGAPIAGASITLIKPRSNYVTDNNGEFKIENLPTSPYAYTLLVSKAGYVSKYAFFVVSVKTSTQQVQIRLTKARVNIKK